MRKLCRGCRSSCNSFGSTSPSDLAQSLLLRFAQYCSTQSLGRRGSSWGWHKPDGHKIAKINSQEVFRNTCTFADVVACPLGVGSQSACCVGIVEFGGFCVLGQVAGDEMVQRHPGVTVSISSITRNDQRLTYNACASVLRSTNLSKETRHVS